MAAELGRDSPPRERARLLARVAVAEAEAVALPVTAITASEAFDALQKADVDEAEILELTVGVARLLKELGAAAPAWQPFVNRVLALVGERRDVAWARTRLLTNPLQPLSEGGIHAGRWLGHDPDAVLIASREGTEDDVARTLEAWDWRDREATHVIDLARTWTSSGAVLRAYESPTDRCCSATATCTRRPSSWRSSSTEAAVGLGSRPGEALTQLALCHGFLGLPDRAHEELNRARAIVEPLGALHRQHLAASVTTPSSSGTSPADRGRGPSAASGPPRWSPNPRSAVPFPSV